MNFQIEIEYDGRADKLKAENKPTKVEEGSGDADEEKDGDDEDEDFDIDDI